MAAAASTSSAAASASPSGGGRRIPATAAVACACPICLEGFEDEAYLDTCLHSFCYECITQWVSIVASKHEEPLSSVKCPLCKAARHLARYRPANVVCNEVAASAAASVPSFRAPAANAPSGTKSVSILHAFDGKSFTRHCIEQDQGKRHLADAHELISQFYNTREISDDTASVLQYWKQRKYLRRNVWLETWLRQEIQALTQDENVEAIVYHIHGMIESFMKTQEKLHASKQTSPEHTREEFRSLLSDAARPFLLGRTARFVTEVELFLISQRNIDAYSRVRLQRFKESASHVAREQDVLPQDRPLEDHYLYLLSEETDCVGGVI